MAHDLETYDVDYDDDIVIKEKSIELIHISERHKHVSKIKTPKGYIKKKLGYDYVELKYMKRIADKEYPGWSFTIVKSEFVGDHAYLIHGRLKWFDIAVWREGDMVVSHRIQKSKEDQNKIIDISNDLKASVTDCIKKAFNTYLNIADDVYRQDDIELSDGQKEKLIETARKINPEMETKIKNQIEDMLINEMNYEAAIKRLKRLKE